MSAVGGVAGIRLALFGAAPDTPNMGVSALFLSTVSALSERLDDVEFIVFDNGLGLRTDQRITAGGRPLRIRRFGARGGRRYHRPENLLTMTLSARMGGLGGMLNRAVRLIDQCDAVLDISGGDSFSDIYGRERFDNIWRPKAIALARRKPLILLPQTYGPFEAADVRTRAARVVAQADMAWARDPDSFEALMALAGPAFDPARHRQGVDMAFGLRPTPAADRLDPGLRQWLADKTAERPLVGLNVSGLIYNDPQAARRRYRFKADYCRVVCALVDGLIRRSSARVLLIPHVMDKPGHYESDLGACIDVAAQCGHGPDRLRIAPADLDQSQVKWLISQVDWFCGTRMHSTIAALSSGVPTAAIAYSGKTAGVFESCGQRAQVRDPRVSSTDELIADLLHAYEQRAAVRERLARHLPAVRRLLDEQIDAICARVRAAAQQRVAPLREVS